MAPYIEKNTKLRMEAKNKFEKDFFKLMNNSVFGKTMENIRNRVDIKFVTSRKGAAKLFKKPNFTKFKIFSEDFIAIHMKQRQILFNKPIYLGMSILDLSKNLMFEFHYDYIKPKYGEKAKLCYTDTDSLIYEIETEDFYEDIKDDLDEWFDTSDYPADHPSGLKSQFNKKKIGKFKDEALGKIISKFVALRSKSYSFKTQEVLIEILNKIT